MKKRDENYVRRRMVFRSIMLTLLGFAGLLWQRQGLAYPTSIIFAPSAETLAFGEGNVSAYVPLNVKPSLLPGASWFGGNIGLVPAFSYGSGFEFGGFEVGLDVINGAIHHDNSIFAKPIFNAKATLLSQTEHVPALGIGLMSFAPFQLRESVNYTYFAVSKTITVKETEIGSFTLGLGNAIGAKKFAFQGSLPFKDTRWALLAGYVSPEYHRFSLAVDTLGGTSETSATSVAVNFAPSDSAYVMVGAYFSNDRSVPEEEIYDGVFVTIGVSFPCWTETGEEQSRNTRTSPFAN